MSVCPNEWVCVDRSGECACVDLHGSVHISVNLGGMYTCGSVIDKCVRKHVHVCESDCACTRGQLLGSMCKCMNTDVCVCEHVLPRVLCVCEPLRVRFGLSGR